MTDIPTTPADERNGEPYYIDSFCSECGTKLELFDEESGWNDEWECPNCEDGIRMDWPQAEMDKLTNRMDEV